MNLSPAGRIRAPSAHGPLASAAAALLFGALSATASASPPARAKAKAAATASTATEPPVTDGTIEGRAPELEPRRREPPRTAAAVRRQSSVMVDGRLDEPAWRVASAQTTFWQREPHEGGPSRFATEFRVLFDDQALYVGVRAFDPEPARIRGLLTRRDVDSSSDWISVKIDSYHDRRTAFGFSVNPAGVQRDVLHFNDVEQDPGWDAVWESSASVDGEGWTAELRIPYSQLRFPGAVEQSWGLQVLRRVQRTQELSAWSPWPKEAGQEVSLYGTMVGIRGIGPTRRLELLPYALGGAQLYDPDQDDPVLDGHDAVIGLGVDVKYGLGSNFTLSGTINPDFGQVEADPSQVNLSANETFFQEKRPFFLEGTDIFRFSLGQGDGDGAVETLFYTRRIGATPHADPYDYGDFTDAPDVTTIYSAAKLSGKTASGWSVGLLDAVTGQEDALVAPEGGSAADSHRVILEPLTNYAVARVRKDLREGRTQIGAALTSVHRSLEGTKLGWLHDRAYTGGIEGVHRFWDEKWTADFRLAGSYVHGSPEALDETQTSSVHYYQRPDADHLDYDPTRTSLTGAAFLWSFGKTAGGHWRFQTGADTRTPGFEANDIGFQRGADYYIQWVWAQYREDKPRFLKNYAVNFNAWRLWDWSPQTLTTGGNVNGNFDLRNYWGAGGGIGVDWNVQDPGGLRGGPLLHRDPVYPAWLNAWSDSRRQVNATLAAFGFWAPASGSYGGNITPLINVQARGNLELSAGPTLAYNIDDNQYVDEVADTMGDPHYVMAHIRQLTAALTLRASYTFSPRMGLQLYAQPFVSTGRYGEYKEPINPQADDYDDRYYIFEADQVMDDADRVRSVDRNRDGVTDFAFDLGDFNFRELRSNLVFRWEYRPGSTFFLIWSHGRTSESEAPDGRFVLADDLSALADEQGEHVILAKLNYWLGL